MVTRVPGHSLPELLVAMTFLAAAAVAVNGTAVLGAREVRQAEERQEALRLASAVLDSLAETYAGDPGVRAGTWQDRLAVEWQADSIGGLVLIRVAVRSGAGQVLASLSGVPRPRVPVLPDDGAGSGPAGP